MNENELQAIGTELTLDFSDAGEDEEFLVQKAHEFVNVEAKARFQQAKILKEVNERDANNKNGTFGKFCRELGIKRTTAHYMITSYEYIVQNLNNISEAEKIPKTLLYAVASSSTPQKLKTEVANGEIKTLKEFNARLKAEKEKAEQQVAELKVTEASLHETIRRNADEKAELEDKLANAENRPNKELEKAQAEIENLKKQKDEEVRTLKEALSHSRQEAKMAKESAELYKNSAEAYQKSSSEYYEELSKVRNQAEKNVEQSPKYQKLLKENETFKAHIQGKSLEQHAKETNQPELRRSRKEEARIIEAIDSIAAALSKLPAKVEMSEWAEVYIREQEMLLSFTRETLERSIPNLQMLLDEFKGQTGIRRIK